MNRVDAAIGALERHGASEEADDLTASAIEFYEEFAALEASLGRAKARRSIIDAITKRGFSKKDAESMIDTVGNRGALAKAIRTLGDEKNGAREKKPPSE